MGRKQKHLLNATFIPRPLEPLRTSLGRAKQSECVGDLTRLILGNARWIMRLLEIHPGLC